MMSSSIDEPDFQATQLQWTAHVRDPDQSAAPKGIEERRLTIYRDLIFNNIESFLSGGFPILKSIIEHDDWQLLVRDFIIRHRCQTPYFLEISQEFLSYLSEQETTIFESLPFALELAHYEWVELALDVSPEVLPPEVSIQSEDLLHAPLVVSPLAWRLIYQYPVHLIGPDYHDQDVPDEPTHLIVYRNRAEEVKFLESSRVTLRLIQLLEDNSCNAREALLQIADELEHSDPEFVVSSGSETIKQLYDFSIVCGRDT